MRYKLSDVCSYGNGRIRTSSLNLNTYISTENLLPDKGGLVKAAKLPSTPQATRFDKGDVLVSNIRPYFKKIWFADRIGGCSNDVLNFRVKENNYSKFLYYVLSDDKFFDYSMSTAKGTKMPRGDKAAIMNYNVPLKTYQEQKAIADTLSCLDDKIELNNKINENLEQQAQAIFKSWFVDFEPFQDGEFEESELGVIPKGWRVFKLNELFNHIKPGTNYQPKRILDGIPFLNIRNVNNGYIDLSDVKYISQDDYDFVHKTWKPEANDILISRIGTLGLVAAISEEHLPIAVHYNFIVIKSEYLPFQFIYFMLKSENFQQSYDLIKKQSVQEYVTIDDVEKIKIAFPKDLDEATQAVETLSRFYDCISSNQRQNKKLQMIRDGLLPKLMSGEIEVTNPPVTCG